MSEPTSFELPPEHLAEIQMTLEMYAASPDGKAQVRKVIERFPTGTIEIAGIPGVNDE